MSSDSNPTPSKTLKKQKSSNIAESEIEYARIKAANRLSIAELRSTYFPSSSPLRHYSSKSSGMKFNLSLHSVTSLPATVLKTCFSLIEETSSEAYKASQNGWKPRAKWREMREPDMKYVLVYREDRSQPSDEQHDFDVDQSGEVFCGFMSFQLSIEPPFDVLYIYEIHLVESARGIGLGYHLMKVAEEVGRGVGVAKTMLTVYTSNTKARKFYERLGYSIDDISPADRELRRVIRPADFAILSKTLQEELFMDNNTQS